MEDYKTLFIHNFILKKLWSYSITFFCTLSNMIWSYSYLKLLNLLLSMVPNEKHERMKERLIVPVLNPHLLAHQPTPCGHGHANSLQSHQAKASVCSTVYSSYNPLLLISSLTAVQVWSNSTSYEYEFLAIIKRNRYNT